MQEEYGDEQWEEPGVAYGRMDGQELEQVNEEYQTVSEDQQLQKSSPCEYERSHPHEEGVTLSHTPMESPVHQAEQQRPAQTEILKVYESVNSTINNLLNNRAQVREHRQSAQEDESFEEQRGEHSEERLNSPP